MYGHSETRCYDYRIGLDRSTGDLRRHDSLAKPSLRGQHDDTCKKRDDAACPYQRPNSVTHEIPQRGFYIAHLLSGSISTTIDGETTEQPPGAYWTVKAGATMQVKVLGEFAVLETIVAAKR